MGTKEKKVLRFNDDDFFIGPREGSNTPLDDITLRSSIGSPMAASSVARPLLQRGDGYGMELENSHAQLFHQIATSFHPPGHGDGEDIPDSARSRASFAPSEVTDTSLGILNLDDLASGLEELDDEFMNLSQDPHSPRSGIGDGEEMAPGPGPAPSLPSPSPRDGGQSRMAVSQMSAPSIMFFDSQEEEDEEDRGIASDLSDGQATPVPMTRFRSETQGNEGTASSEIDTEDELNAVRNELAHKRRYVPSPADRLGVGESRDNSVDVHDHNHGDRPPSQGSSSQGGGRVPRLQLEGGSSGEEGGGLTPMAEPRQSAEGEVVIPDPGDGGGGGDGMSDGETISSGVPDAPATFGQSTLLAFQGLGVNRTNRDWSTAGPLLFDGDGAVDGPVSAYDHNDADDEEEDLVDERTPHMEDQSRVQPIGETDIWQQGAMSFSKMPSPSRPQTFANDFDQDNLSRSSMNAGDPFQGASFGGFAAGSQEPAFNHPFTGDGAYNPFDDGPGADQNTLGGADLGFGSSEEFLASDDAHAMMAEDQEQFEKDNIFRQDENMSHDLGEPDSWELPDGRQLTLRQSVAKSRLSHWEDEKSYQHSADAVFAMRSEALGSLSGDNHSDKPHFGDGSVISPPPQQAFPLVNMSMVRPHDNDDDGLFAASQREAGVGENTHEISRLSLQSPPKPAGRSSMSGTAMEGTTSPRSSRDGSGGNRSGVYVPSGKNQFPVRRQRQSGGGPSNEIRNLEKSEYVVSPTDSPDGFRTPPMDMSLVTAAIANASSNMNSNELAKMILLASQQAAAAKREAKGKAQDAAKKGGVEKQGAIKSTWSKTRKESIEPEVRKIKPRVSDPKKGFAQSLSSPDIPVAEHEKDEQKGAQVNRGPKISSDRSNSGKQERVTLKDAGRSSKNQILGNANQDYQDLEVTLSKPHKMCNHDGTSAPSDLQRMESRLGDDYFAEVTRLDLPSRETGLSDTIDFQDLGENDGLMRNGLRKTGESNRNVGRMESGVPSEGVLSSHGSRKATDWDSVPHHELSREEDLSNTDNEVELKPQRKLTDMDMEKQYLDAGKLQAKRQHSTPREPSTGAEQAYPQNSQNIPSMSRMRSSKGASGELISQRGHSNREDLALESRRGNGEASDVNHLGELRSQSIPDGEPTQRGSAVGTAKTYSAKGQGSTSPQQYQQISQPVPRKKQASPNNVIDIPVSQRNSLDRSPGRGRDPPSYQSVEQNRALGGTSFRRNVPRDVPSQNDDVFKKPLAPGARKKGQGVVTEGYGALTVDAVRKFDRESDSADVRPEFDASRFSLDSQADIVIGKHRLVQTPREKRGESALSDLVGGMHKRQLKKQFNRLGSFEEGPDIGIDADVDSGFSSENPNRMSNSWQVPSQLLSTRNNLRGKTVNGVGAVQLGVTEMPNSLEEDQSSGQNFSMMTTEVLSPTPSPRQSPGQSPNASEQNRSPAGSDLDRTLVRKSPNCTLVAETPDLTSPRSNSSSSSRSRSLNASASSGSERSCSTPKRKQAPDIQISMQSHVSDPGYSASHLLHPVPQPYVSTISTLSSASDPAMRSMLSTQSAPPTFYTNQALSQTNFLHHYLNDRPISRPTIPVSLAHPGGIVPSVASHSGILEPLPPQPHSYHAQNSTLGTNFYAPPPSVPLTVPVSGALPGVRYPLGLQAHPHHQAARRSRSRSVEPNGRTSPLWPLYSMQDTKLSDAAGVLETSIHPPLSYGDSPTGHPPIHPGDMPSVSGQQAIVSNLIVSSDHRIRDVACIGIAVQDTITLQNPSARWLQCFLEVVSLTVNGEEVDQPSRVFLMRPRLIIGPHTSEKHRVTFAPRQPGLHEAKVQVGSSPIVADSEVGLLRVTAPHMVTLRGVAELPEIEVEGVVKSRLDFGEMVFGSERAKTIRLINRGHASLPVRLFFVNKTSALWYAASMSTENGQDHTTNTSPRRPLHFTLLGRSTTTIDGEVFQPPSSVAVKLTTQPRASHPDATLLGPADVIDIDLKIELDVPDRTVSLADVQIGAKVGVAKLHLPDVLAQERVFLFSSTVGNTTSRNLLLKNAGNIRLELRLRLPRGVGSFEVVPETLTLDPLQERDILVRFTPKEETAVVDVPLFIQARPDGPNYELSLRGEITTRTERVQTRKAPSILCNKDSLAWPGIHLGKSSKKSAILRNPSAELVSLKLVIRDGEDFKLVSSHGNQTKLSSTRQIVLKARQDYPFEVVFSPTQLACVGATLDVKPVNGSTKYTIPLTGYGGVSSLVIEDINLKGDTYFHDVGPLTPGQHTVLTVKVHNTGLRAAFVKAMCFSDSRSKLKIPSSHLNVEPSEFVISPKMKKTLTLIFNPKDSDFESVSGLQEVAAVGLFYGDEVLRQQLRRASGEGTLRQASLSADNPLRGVSFDATFLGEEHCKENFNMTPGPNTWSMFYSNMSRVLLRLAGTHRRKERTPPKGHSPPQALRKEVPLPPQPRTETAHGIVLGQETLTFDSCLVGQSRMLKLMCKNTSREDQKVKFLNPDPPFYISHRAYTIQAKHFVRVPVTYRPQAAGRHQGFMVVLTSTQHCLVAQLAGECL